MTSTALPIPPGGAHSQAPLPLPHFTFPAPAASAPSSYSRNSTRRPVSAIQVASGPPDLPSFSFGAVSSTGLASPPPSPGTRTIPSRPGGHKRGASELIGRDGGASLLSTSPSKTTETLSPAPRRKGHQHRRSAAISVSDVSLIMKPDNVQQRAESAPVSPATGQEPRHLRFAEQIEVIPRPVSLVSSESSEITIRAGHSTTGSLSSIVSTSSPSKERPNGSSATSTMGARPKTASARLDFTPDSFSVPDVPSPRRHSSNPILNDATTPTAPGSPCTLRSTPKKWTFFGHDDSSGSNRSASADSSRESGPNSSDLSLPIQTNPEIPIASTEQSTSRPTSVPRKPSKKKQKKVKSWAGSILSRKSRQRAQKLSRRSPTPPHRSYGPMDETTMLDVERLTRPDSTPESHHRPEISADISSWVPRRVQMPDEEIITSPIIDLDAALGPFNTPSGRDSEWAAFNRGSGAATRGKRMHSAALMGNFGGPGMHYHRRAASSPEFENPRFGIRHLNSNSTMADVFEEDEEDDAWEDAKAASDKETSSKAEDDDEGGSGIDIKVVDAEDMHADKAMDWTLDEASKRGVKRKGSGLSEADRRQMTSTMKSTNVSTLLKDEVILEESPSSVEIADDSIPPRPDSGAHSSDSTATPPFQVKSAKDLAPVDIQPFSLQSPYLTPTSPHSTSQSPFPSPRSPFSYDTQRISTAPSSITSEGGFQSLLLGEPGPELRMSVDDVPSLTSSNSTMTRDSASLPMPYGAAFRDGQRSASLSSATATRKRSSIASLSRLISSSHGERSKLSIEYHPGAMETDRKEKASKGKRISRMMQFWKPKDPLQ